MNLYSTLERVHLRAKANRWLHYFSIFLRLALCLGFITSGMVKIVGERFASGLSVYHPMGHYLEALHQTGFYYTFIGVMQVIAALLLLVPRTVAFGVLIYFPIILNICVLSYSVRFEGSSLTAPLMVLACLFLICWNYDKFKFILPFHPATHQSTPVPITMSSKFPVLFFIGVFVTVIAIVAFLRFGFELMPRNNLKDCNSQFIGTNRTQAGAVFCDCIHRKGLPLRNSINQYQKLPDDAN